MCHVLPRKPPFSSLYLGASLPSIVAIHTRVSHSFSSFYPESDRHFQPPASSHRISVLLSLREFEKATTSRMADLQKVDCCHWKVSFLQEGLQREETITKRLELDSSVKLDFSDVST
jgi:hypothetical protein